MKKIFTHLLLILGVASVAQAGVMAHRYWLSARGGTMFAYEVVDVFNPIDFEVQAIGNRRFVVRFYNDTDGVFLRVYDVIGNLIYQERIVQKGVYVKEFDMSTLRSEVYIVEVGNTKYSTTKRVFLK